MLITSHLLVLSYRKEWFKMSNTTKTSVDKAKLLNQMQADVAGDEYADCDADENRASKGVKHHDIVENLDEMETIHLIKRES